MTRGAEPDSRTERPTQLWRVWLISLALGSCTLAVFWPVRTHEFLNWDDLTYVSTNDHVRGGLTWDGIAWAFTHSYSSNWHPLAWISHMLDCQLFGLNPGAHHLVNLAFHVANTLLLFGLLRHLTGALWSSALVAALFALHPLHVESVAWVAERKDVLSTFFFLLTLFAYAKYVGSLKSKAQSLKSESAKSAIRNPQSAIEGSSILWYSLSLFLFALGLMSKPMLVTLPCVLLLLDYWPLGRWELRSKNAECRSQQPAGNARAGSSTTASSLPFILHPSSFILLLEKLPFLALSAASCIVTVIAQKRGGAVATFQMVPLSVRFENAAVAYVQYLAKAFWPVNLSPIYAHPTHLDPWLVAGAIGLLLALTVAAWHWRARFPFALAGWLWFLGTLVPVIGVVQVGSQAYADRYTYIPLIGVFIAVAWPLGQFKVQGLKSKVSKLELEGRGPNATEPKPFAAFPVMGGLVCLVVLALLAWRSSAQLAYWRDTGTLFGRALALDPNNVQALYGLGSYLVENGRLDEGKALLEKAIQLQPSYPEALGTLANLLDGQGKYQEAIRFYQAALRAQPNQDGALNNLAWLRASCPDPAFRDGPEAVRLATEACELTGYSKPLFIGTLAAAQAEAGDFATAITTAQRAAQLATALRLDDIAARNQQLIVLYRQGKTAHDTPPK